MLTPTFPRFTPPALLITGILKGAAFAGSALAEPFAEIDHGEHHEHADYHELQPYGYAHHDDLRRRGDRVFGRATSSVTVILRSLLSLNTLITIPEISCLSSSMKVAG